MLPCMASRTIGFGASIVIAACTLTASGCDDGGCKREQRIAIELTVRNLAGRDVEVTAELDGKGEQSCDRTSDLNVGIAAGGRVFTCIEQGGGSYTVRVYSEDNVIHEEQIEVEADECHIKELVKAEIDLAS